MVWCCVDIKYNRNNYIVKFMIVFCFLCFFLVFVFFFFKQKTAYEIGTGDWSSDVCSSDLGSESIISSVTDL